MSNEYWLARAKERNKLLDTYENTFMRNMQDEYSYLFDTYRDKVGGFYGRYADKEGVLSRSIATKPLSHSESLAFKNSLRTVRDKLDLVDDIGLQKGIDKAIARKYITRHDKLLLQMEISTHTATKESISLMDSTLKDEMREAYAFTAYTLERAGLGVEYGVLRRERIAQVINYPWSGDTFKGRMWNDKEKLITNVKEVMTRAEVQGLSVKQSTKELAKRMNSTMSDAERIIRTESTYVAVAATTALYESAGFDWFEYIAVLDGRTTDICNGLNGKVYKMSESIVGVNTPPMHPNCRSDIAPAQGKDNPYVINDTNLTYKQWKLLDK